MKLGWIDAHTHLNSDVFVEDFVDVLNRALEAQIVRINLVGVDLKDTHRALSLVDKYELFDVSVGLHPSSLKEYSQEVMEWFEELAHDPRVVCVGEIGLDYHWHTDNMEEQKRVFRNQIHLANKVGKPVMIHSRKAMRDTIDILKEVKPQYGCVMHCFSGTVDEALECIELGFMISIGGPVTFKNGQEAREVVKVVPLSQLLIETDAPYLTPHPYRGKRNESSYIPYIGEKVAEIKEIEVAKLQEVLINNYKKTFGPK